MFERIYTAPPEEKKPLKIHGIRDVKLKDGSFFNTHIERGWCIASPVPLMARLFGKRLRGEDSGVKCAGIYYKGVLYITKVQYPVERKGWKVLGVK